MVLPLRLGSWLSAIYLIFSAMVWLVGGFLITAQISSGQASMDGLELIPQIFWPIRATVSALGVVAAVILVLSRPAFLRVIVFWFVAELALLGWLYATGFLSSQIDSIEQARSIAIGQVINGAVVLFAWVKHKAIYQ